MTTPYAVSTNIGSSSYNYVNAPITGPLSTPQTPHQLPYHKNAVLHGHRPSPPQFYPTQEPLYSNMNTNSRHTYLRTSKKTTELAKQIALGKLSTPHGYQINSSGKIVAVSSHTNYIAPLSSSLYINTLKSNTVGKFAYKVNLPNTESLSTKNYFPSGTRSAIRRARSGGCVAPKKKGAIENVHLSNGKVCAWGSTIRQNY